MRMTFAEWIREQKDICDKLKEQNYEENTFNFDLPDHDCGCRGFYGQCGRKNSF